MYGSEAVYSCAPGYEIKGRVNLTRQCTAECPTESIGDFQYTACRDGYWTGGTPICKRELARAFRRDTLSVYNYDVLGIFDHCWP